MPSFDIFHTLPITWQYHCLRSMYGNMCRSETNDVPTRLFHIRSANFLLTMLKQIVRLYYGLAANHKMLHFSLTGQKMLCLSHVMCSSIMRIWLVNICENWNCRSIVVRCFGRSRQSSFRHFRIRLLMLYALMMPLWTVWVEHLSHCWDKISSHTTHHNCHSKQLLRTSVHPGCRIHILPQICRALSVHRHSIHSNRVVSRKTSTRSSRCLHRRSIHRLRCNYNQYSHSCHPMLRLAISIGT